MSSSFCLKFVSFFMADAKAIATLSWPATIRQSAPGVVHPHSVTVTEAQAAPTEQFRVPFGRKLRSARYSGQTKNVEFTKLVADTSAVSRTSRL
jgi:hypothetical protein